jgi:hypothetical protein
MPLNWNHDEQPASSIEPGEPVPPTIAAFSLRGSLSPLLLVPIALPVVAALFAPDNVLDLWPLAGRFVQAMQRLLPFIRLDGHASSTGYPQAALLTHCLTLCVVVITSVVWLVQGFVNYDYLLRRRRALGPLKVGQHLALLLVGPPFVLLFLYALVVLPGDPSFARGMTANNRLGFAFLTFVANYITGLILGVQVLNLRLLVDTHLRPRSRRLEF